MKNEPVLIFLAGLAVVVDSGLVAATKLQWLSWNGDQCAAVVLFVSAFCGLIAAVLRDGVYSPATVERLTGSDVD